MKYNRHYRRKLNRLERGKKTPFTRRAVGALAIASGSMLALALPNVLNGTGPITMLKTVLIAGTATIVAYSVNRLAIEKGAPLSAIGFRSAGAASVVAMLAVGGGLFASTYSGLVHKDVAELQLQEHGTKIVRFIGYRNQMAVEAARLLPVVNAIVSDLKTKSQCEIRESCISLKGSGGRGPVARKLEATSARAIAIREQLNVGETARQSFLRELNRLIAEYQRIIGETDRDIWDRRLALQKLDAKIDQTLSLLDESIPVSLLKSYVDELRRGVVVPDNPAAASRLDAILKGHGDGLEAVLDSFGKGDQTRPPFPRRTGVTDTFRYAAHFLPIGLLTAVVELIFPLALWFFSFLTLYWKIYRNDPPVSGVRKDEDEFGGLIDLETSPEKNNVTNFRTHHRPRRHSAPRPYTRRR